MLLVGCLYYSLRFKAQQDQTDVLGRREIINHIRDMLYLLLPLRHPSGNVKLAFGFSFCKLFLSALTVLGTIGDTTVNKHTYSHRTFTLTGGDTFKKTTTVRIYVSLVSKSDVCCTENIESVLK